jgi:hypothetical protein
MCFSASASFSTGVILGVVGILSLKKAQAPSEFAFAAIPLLFSIQQFTEGVVWLSLTNKNFEEWGSVSTHLFLIFAQIVWPVWVPLSLYLIEKNTNRKKMLLYLTNIGIFVAICFAYCQIFYPVKTEINTYHIVYSLSFPLVIVDIAKVFYVIATVISPFISTNRNFQLLGICNLVTLIFTIQFFSNAFISVWCYFAAVISVVVLYLIIELHKPIKLVKVI